MREAFKSVENWEQHFWFDKDIVRTGLWARLPRAAQAAFPVIAAHCDRHGTAFPSQWRIGAQCGRTERALHAPLKKLVEQAGCVTRELKTTARGRQQYWYRVTFPPRERGRSFPFHKAIIDGGNWRLLKPTAQALYPVLRTFSHVCVEDVMEEADCSYVEINEYFGSVSIAEFEGDWDTACRYSGISGRSVDNAATSLIERGLLSFDDDRCLVYRKPKHTYKAAYLNAHVPQPEKKNAAAELTLRIGSHKPRQSTSRKNFRVSMSVSMSEE